MAQKPKDRWIIRMGVLAGLIGLAVLLACLLPGPAVQAKSNERPVYQDETSYPNDIPTDESVTPEITETLVETEAVETLPEGTLVGLPTETEMPTATSTATLAPNVFLTENSQMQGAQVTPVASETPGPTLTPYETPTVTKAASLGAATSSNKKSGGPQVDWGLFWIGFSLPVLVGCGFVLYLLDRRPNLFKPRSK